MPDLGHCGGRIDRQIRREWILETLEDECCAHLGEIAFIVRLPKSTIRRDLEWLADEGFVEGVKHDERNIAEIGRVRIYWSLTAQGLQYRRERANA